MQSASDLNQLTYPLIERALFHGLRTHDFRDRAAYFVLERLGIGEGPQFKTDSHHKSEHIEVSTWIDNKVQSFFDIFPLGQGIEVCSGLSTRFHRLSERSEWPRFKWQSINTPNIDDCLQFVFPRMDNYRSLASDAPLGSWAEYVGWCDAPAIVIVGEERALTDMHELNALIRSLEHVFIQGFFRVDVVLRHRIERIQKHLHINEKTIIHHDSYCAKAPGKPVLLRPFRKLSRVRSRPVELIHFTVIRI